MKTPPNKWVLLIGGPNSGKSTMAAHLGACGYAVKEEQARYVLDNYIEREIPFSAITSDPQVGASFQVEIAEMEMAAEERCDPNVLTFFDRTCIEYQAFMNLRGFTPDPALLERLRGRSYGLAIALEVIPSAFAGDKLESELVDPVAESNRQARALLDIVEATGTTIEYVPVMTVEERADYIISLCMKHGLYDEAGPH